MAKQMHKIEPLNQADFEIGGKDPIYPSLSIKETDLPSIKDKKIDDEFEVTIKVKVNGIHKGRAGDVVLELDQREIGLNK